MGDGIRGHISETTFPGPTSTHVETVNLPMSDLGQLDMLIDYSFCRGNFRMIDVSLVATIRDVVLRYGITGELASENS